VAWVLALLLGAVASLALGIGSAWMAVRSPAPIDAITVGAWQAWPNAGTADVDPYSRARLARTGEIPLGSGEGLALFALADERGRPLLSACDYRIVGQTPPARLWTLALERDDGRPVFDRGAAAAISSDALLRMPDGAFEVAVSRAPNAGNWISPGASGRFRIVLRLYDTTVRTVTGLTTLPMPRILRESCG
jgi:hypothetical protein